MCKKKLCATPRIAKLYFQLREGTILQHAESHIKRAQRMLRFLDRAILKAERKAQIEI